MLRLLVSLELALNHLCFIVYILTDERSKALQREKEREKEKEEKKEPAFGFTADNSFFSATKSDVFSGLGKANTGDNNEAKR